MRVYSDINNLSMDVGEIVVRVDINGEKYAGMYMPACRNGIPENRTEIIFRDLWEFEEYCHTLAKLRDSLYEKLHIQADERVKLTNW